MYNFSQNCHLRKMFRLVSYLRPILHMCLIITISYYLSYQKTNLSNKKITRYLPDLKYLLIWTDLPGVKEDGQRHFINNQCGSFNCFLTKNRSLFGDIRYFDAIIFNVQDISQRRPELPRVRNMIQKYIFAANDSSDNYPVCDPVFDNFFNWTWTYKSDSTIPYRFITIFNMENQELGNDFKWTPINPIDEQKKFDISTKSKAAAIFLDKCESRSKREVFLKNLQNYLTKYKMQIDVYGKCGTMECRRKTMKPCYWKLKKNYFFYLAFEDSFAVDFVTKTVLYAYNNNVVPIVYGKAGYNRYLPPGSYIDALALGEEKLALTMYQIAFDRPRYLEFFKWKNFYTIKESNVLDPCALCSALNNPRWLMHQVTYTNFRKWWNEDYEARCSELSFRTMTKYIIF